VRIWLARSRDGEVWSEPACIADGCDERGRPLPCWNPVLHALAHDRLLLFYRVGPSPRRWWTLLRASEDGGASWSAPRGLPAGFLGPIRCKPLARPDGLLLCPSSTEHFGWRCHLEWYAPASDEWHHGPVLNHPWRFLALQPTLLDHGEGRLQALCRTRQRVVSESWSDDGGASWTAMRATELPNPNSGIDALTLEDGRHLLVCNPVRRGRTPLVIAMSSDGRQWRPVTVLDEGSGEYSYPAIIQGSDQRIHITWTWQRQRIRHLAMEPDAIS
jgi:predicted neuraminidase